MSKARQTIIWTQSLDHSTYKASAHGALLTVIRQALDEWIPTVEWPDGTQESSHTRSARTEAQAWCEQRAGGGSD